MQRAVKLSLIIHLDISLGFIIWTEKWKFHFFHLEAIESREGMEERMWDGIVLALSSLHGWWIAGRGYRIDGPHKNVEMSTA